MFRNTSIAVLIISAVAIITLLINLFSNTHPILNFVKYMETTEYYWTVPLTVTAIFGLWLFDRQMRKKIIRERIEIFNATIHTLQDVLQNSTSSMQLLILDLKDEGINSELILKLEKNQEELNSVINALASIDPTNMQFKELNKNLSIIKMQ